MYSNAYRLYFTLCNNYENNANTRYMLAQSALDNMKAVFSDLPLIPSCLNFVLVSQHARYQIGFFELLYFYCLFHTIYIY